MTGSSRQDSAARNGAGHALAADLAARVRGQVRFDSASRAVFAADASNYRHVPVGVVQPADTDDVLATLEVCRQHDVPVLPRGAATSIGGQAVNEAVVIDFSRHLRSVLSIDPEQATARIQPGVVLDDLRAAAAPHGLTFGPDPSTHSRCTVGGMIGNNACGSHSVAWGKTVDNVRGLTVVTYDGTQLTAGPTTPEEAAARAQQPGEAGRIYRRLAGLASTHADLVRAQTPRLTRRVSGYNLDQLLPENGFNLARALTGTEGSCVTVLEATVGLVPVPAARALTVAGFADAFVAADVAPEFLDLAPLTIEGMDVALIAALRAARPADQRYKLLPDGAGWLFIETGGATAAEAGAAARAIAARAQQLGGTATIVTDGAAQRTLWGIREAGAGIVTRGADGTEAWPGWEDAAVPPERLGAYLRQFQKLLDGHGRRGAYYGHFGDGCVHVRIDFDLITAPGIAGFRRFIEDAADLVTAHGGSLSGEHGDGQARSELLPRMYPAEMIAAFADFKGIWDPRDKMNPGAVVRPRRLDADLRVYVSGRRPATRTQLAFAHDGGSLEAATRRCVGVGACLSGSGNVMCPSYRATGEEQHSTRGRARLLFEFASGRAGVDAAHADDVAGALDLCLSCKGCKRDCPVGVDMAAYKAEFLAQRYAGRRRPAAHYSLGWLPRWLRLISRTRSAALLNRAAKVRALAAPAKRLGGIAPERDIPALAGQSFQAWFAGRGARPDRCRAAPAAVARHVHQLPGAQHRPGCRHRAGGARLPCRGAGPAGVLRPDLDQHRPAGARQTGHDPDPGHAETLAGRGGAHRRARTQLHHRAEVGGHRAAAGPPRGQAGQRGRPLAGRDPPPARRELRSRAAQQAAGQGLRIRPLGRARSRPLGRARSRPRQHGKALVQVHCHQHADLGFDADREVLAALGVQADVLDSGCCGLAGNFGFERGHYEVSQACGERVLFPAIRADRDASVVADGYSCRTQIRQATGGAPVHLAHLAAAVLAPPA